MSAAAPVRRARHRWHAPEKGSGPAFALSLLAHAVLFIAIAFMVRWKSEPVAAVSAELWTLPPAAVQQPTPPPPPRPVQVEPPPPPPEPRKADIVMEQKKVLPPKVDPKKITPPDPPKKQDTKAADLKRAAEEKKADQAEREAAAKAADATMKRVLAQAGPQASAAGAGLSNAYRAQIVGCIRPHIIFNVPDAVRPQLRRGIRGRAAAHRRAGVGAQVGEGQRLGGIRSGGRAGNTPLRPVSAAKGGNDATLGESAV